jgi:hypothetical protein
MQSVIDKDDAEFLLKVRQMAVRCMNQPHLIPALCWRLVFPAKGAHAPGLLT